MGSRYDDVLRAAVELFAQRGYAATGIRDLSSAIGLTSASLYHYAGGKEELLVSVMRGCLGELLDSAHRAVASSGEAPVQLGRLICSHVGLSAMNPLTARVTDDELRSLGPENREELLALRDGYETLVDRVVRRGRRAGQLQVDDPRLTRLALIEMCNGVANWYLPTGRLGVTQVQRRFVDLGGRLVGAAPLAADELGPIPKPLRLVSEPLDPNRRTQEA